MHQHRTAAFIGPRIVDLDGLRGWASLSVVLFHIFWETFGVIVPGFRNELSAALFNGQMAVAIFFVLSGEALSTPYWMSETRRAVIRQMIKRYPRLTVPIFFSCLIVFTMLVSGLSFSKEAAVIVNRPDWLGAFLSFTPDVFGFLRYSLFDVYVNHTSDQSYNPFLWTMKTEMIGSFAVFLTLLVERHIKYKFVFIVVISLVCVELKSFIACFLIGIIFGWMQARGNFLRFREKRWIQIASVAVMIVILGFVAHKQLVGHSGVRPYTIAAVVFVFAVHCNLGVTAFLRNQVSLFLGRISFPLYLVHFPVIISLTSGAIVFAHSRDALSVASVVVIALGSLAASVLAAMAFERVETLARRASGAGLP